MDVQVSIMVAAIATFSCMLISWYTYNAAYENMISSLQERTAAVYRFVEQNFTWDTFQAINGREDAGGATYLEAKRILEEIRKSASIRYLYTAKQDGDGNFIYLVDGLDGASPDFRYPGDLIEEEVLPDIRRAYEGETILPDRILNTSWGNIFLAYYPIRDTAGPGAQVIGVLGMEFDAESQYRTFSSIKLFTPFLILFVCTAAIFLSNYMFRRISNPKARDLYDTDMLTQLKNRNAFDIDMNNMQTIFAGDSIGVIVIDLDGLKKVNDGQGHAVGDRYLQYAAASIRRELLENSWAYRTGGDEFAVIAFDTDLGSLRRMMERIRQNFAVCGEGEFIVRPSLSTGCSIYVPGSGMSLRDVVNHADAAMYKYKKRNRTEQEKGDSGHSC